MICAPKGRAGALRNTPYHSLARRLPAPGCTYSALHREARRARGGGSGGF